MHTCLFVRERAHIAQACARCGDVLVALVQASLAADDKEEFHEHSQDHAYAKESAAAKN